MKLNPKSLTAILGFSLVSATGLNPLIEEKLSDYTGKELPRRNTETGLQEDFIGSRGDEELERMIELSYKQYMGL